MCIIVIIIITISAEIDFEMQNTVIKFVLIRKSKPRTNNNKFNSYVINWKFKQVFIIHMEGI